MRIGERRRKKPKKAREKPSLKAITKLSVKLLKNIQRRSETTPRTSLVERCPSTSGQKISPDLSKAVIQRLAKLVGCKFRLHPKRRNFQQSLKVSVNHFNCSLLQITLKVFFVTIFYRRLFPVLKKVFRGKLLQADFVQPLKLQFLVRLLHWLIIFIPVECLPFTVFSICLEQPIVKERSRQVFVLKCVV